MASKKVCDFCLSEGKGLFNRLDELEDGHYICRDCRRKIQDYGLEVKYDLFQTLVTAQPNMIDMIMDAYLEKNSAKDALQNFYPLPVIILHPGEHCLNAVHASYTINRSELPTIYAVKNIAEVKRSTIHNIGDGDGNTQSLRIDGFLYETEAALYFMSERIVNCHRLGYVKRNNNDNNHIIVETPKKTYTYKVEHSDLFFMRERFFQKAYAALNKKSQHLIYINSDNQYTITPGVYDIPKSLKPGRYRVKAIRDAGLHTRDPLGRVRDYYENEDSIDLSDGGVLECTGEYKLEWIGEADHSTKR